MTDLSKSAVAAMADKLDAEVFARCGVKAAEATVLRALAARIAEQHETIRAHQQVLSEHKGRIAVLEAALVTARADAMFEFAVLLRAQWTTQGIERMNQFLREVEGGILIPSNPTPEPTDAMFGMGGDNDDFDT